MTAACTPYGSTIWSIVSRTSSSASAQATASSIRTVPPARPVAGITLTAEPGPDDPPHDAHPGAGVEPAREHGGQLGDELAEGEGEVLGQVGPRGVPALAREQHVERVGGPGERALPQAHGADVEARVGVQPEDPGDPVERPGLDRHQGAAGHDLLGRLEDQAHPTRHLVRERSAIARPLPRRAAACRSWPHACATPWTVLTHGSGMRSSTGSASRSARRAITGPGPEPMSTTSPLRGSGAGHEAGLVETLGDHRRRPLLGPRQLGVGVQVTPQLDQLGGKQLDLSLGRRRASGREVGTTDKITGQPLSATGRLSGAGPAQETLLDARLDLDHRDVGHRGHRLRLQVATRAGVARPRRLPAGRRLHGEATVVPDRGEREREHARRGLVDTGGIRGPRLLGGALGATHRAGDRHAVGLGGHGDAHAGCLGSDLALLDRSRVPGPEPGRQVDQGRVAGGREVRVPLQAGAA